MSNKNSYIKLLAISLIPIIVILGGTIAGIFLFSNELTVELTDEYINDLSDNVYEESLYTVQQMDKYYRYYSEFTDGLHGLITGLTEDNKDTSMLNFRYNQGTYYPEYSEKYNKTVDFTVSSYKLFTTNLTLSVNETLKSSAIIDSYLPSYYSSYDDILSIELIYEVGIHKVFPHGLQNGYSTDPRNTTLYNSSIVEHNLVISKPYVFKLTNEIAINFTRRIVVNEQIIGVISVSYLFQSLIDSLYAGVQRDTQKIFLYDKQLNIITHSDIDHTKRAWNDTKLNQTVYDVEEASEEFNNSIDISLNGTIYSSVIVDDSIVVLVPSIYDVIFASIVEYPQSPVYGRYRLIDLVAIPTVFIVLFGLISYALMRKYGMIRDIDLEKLASANLIGAVLENIPTSLDDIVEMATDKIDEVGDKGVEILEDASKNLAGDLEEKVLEKVDHIVDTGVQKILDLEQSAIDAKEQFAENTISFLENSYKSLEKMGVDFNEIAVGDFSSLADVAADSKKLEAILMRTESIDVGKLAEVVGKDLELITTWVKKIPEEYGITVDRFNVVYIENDKVAKHLPALIKSYTGIDLNELDVDAVLKGDLSSIEGITEDAIKLGKILNDADSVETQELANTLSVDKEIIEQWVKQSPPEFGLELNVGTINFDKVKIKDNLPAIIKSYMKL